jgi:hypothetical protein
LSHHPTNGQQTYQEVTEGKKTEQPMASSGNFALLASDFQALASETKRKHADIKEVSSAHHLILWMSV